MKSYFVLLFVNFFYSGYREDNVGEPLFLTPFIENGTIEEGRRAASTGLSTDRENYAGFLTVNKQYNSNMFFWYFPAEHNSTTAPVVLWLQGGLGASSLYGIFNEHGPYYVGEEGDLKFRTYHWSWLLNIIYIDNPVGAGFSFTENGEGYAKDEDDVANDLYSALVQFFKLFPDLQNNDFFVAGESFAGKYVPAIAYKIHTSNEINPQKINLKGISIGNGFVDPENMLNYGDYLYQIGLIDSNTNAAFQRKQEDIVKHIQAKNYLQAFEGFDALINGDLTPYRSFFYNQTGFEFYFNFLDNQDDNLYADTAEFVQKDATRKAIHVGNRTFQTDNKVEQYLKQDIMQSAKPLIEKLIEKYRILFYNGQLDIIVPYPLTINFLQQLNWSGADKYKTVRRRKWLVSKELAGYSKSVKGLTEVLVRNAGHMVPEDQPKWALDLIKRFVYNIPF